tara:strand:- start:1562 stop:2473 length:912 start_codon:yes stop_codon:yes gene_type:complete
MKIFLDNPSWGKVTLLRQTSQYSGLTQNAQYFFKENEASQCDYHLTLEPIKKKYRNRSGRDIDTIFYHMENKRIWEPSLKDLDGINIYISPFQNKFAPRNIKYIRYFPCVPWFYGISFAVNAGLLHKPLYSGIELDAIRSSKIKKKDKLISMIVSGKEGTYGHAWRKNLAISLKHAFGDKIDIYGFGFNPIPDKRIALDNYVYSIVIENSCEEYYVTEKIVDCLIGWSIPIYSGAQNIDNLLGVKVPRIEYGCTVETAVKKIKDIIFASEWDYEMLQKARAVAIDKLNIFTALPSLVREGSST